MMTQVSASDPMGSALAGKKIVVTRPVDQAQHLARLIHAVGGTAILFPVLEILESQDPRLLSATLEKLNEFDLAIFISVNAVTHVLNSIANRGSLPPKLKIVAIGLATAGELARFGVTDVIMPSHRFDSEALLTLPEMQRVAGKRIVIFRGDRGRQVLGDTLINRGAKLEYVECYRRVKPSGNADTLYYHWQHNDLHGITVTTVEGLHNLWEMVNAEGRAWLQKTPLFVSHSRLKNVARELGASQVILTGVGDEAMLQGMIKWFSEEKD